MLQVTSCQFDKLYYQQPVTNNQKLVTSNQQLEIPF